MTPKPSPESPSPAIKVDDFIDPEYWTPLNTTREIVANLPTHEFPNPEKRTICAVNRRDGFVVLDKVNRLITFDDRVDSIFTKNGLFIDLKNFDTAIYLYTPPKELPTITGSKIYDVDVEVPDNENVGKLIIRFEFLTLDRNGKWFGMDTSDEMRVFPTPNDGTCKFTKFSLYPPKTNN